MTSGSRSSRTSATSFATTCGMFVEPVSSTPRTTSEPRGLEGAAPADGAAPPFPPTSARTRLGAMRRLVAALIVLAATPSMAGAATATPRELTGQARQLMEGGNLVGALAVMAAARREMARNSILDRELADALAGQLYNLGVRFNNGGKAREAMQCFTEALQLDTLAHGVRDAAFRAGLRDASLKVARYLVSTGDPEAVLEACGVLTRRQPPDPPALCTL